ncbi:hypothetical protein A9Q83_14045 [Alphaproteobacteria bacterium 46_93_T64]|nr:hypothetical protein A9Q83_14045 [Alphaproteobacteria bacterium 46_93_T64]
MNTPATLYLWHGYSLFIGAVTDNGLHRHYALQLTLSTDNKFTITTETKDLQTRLYLSDIEELHSLDSEQSTVAVLLVEPDSAYGSTLKQKITIDFSEKIQDKCISLPFPHNEIEAADYVTQIGAFLGIENTRNNGQSDRITKVIDFLANNNGDSFSAKAMAELANLSESRFLHLFTEQMGLPFRRYIKWKRLLDAVNAASKGNSLTEAAHLAGFSDSAHLSRVFREMIGFTPSKILQDSRFVQVIICD